MGRVTLFKSVEFSSAHKLYNQHLNHELNLRLYGKCTVEHGHNYRLLVGIEGYVNPVTGMIINMTDFKSMIEEHIVKKLDHQNLSHVPELKESITTLETLVIWIWNQLEGKIPQVTLKELILYETERTFVSYRGEV